MHRQRKSHKSESFEQKYINFIDDATVFKKETNGYINLFESQTNGRTVLKLFENLTRAIPTDKIKYDEGVWIEATKSGAIIWGDQYMGEGYKYDYCSMYPSIMNAANSYPVKRGKFKVLTQEEFMGHSLSEIGIYRCVVEKQSDNQYAKKLFRWNPKNFYTNVDLLLAKELNLKVIMVRDRQPNYLSYSEDACMKGYDIFGTYVDLIFPLKHRKIPRAKQFLTMLWGVLGQRSDLGYSILRENSSMLDISSLNFKQLNGNIYRTNYARTIPFILAYGRAKISTTMMPFISNVVRCATDGFIAKIPLEISTGTNMGELRYEGYCKKCIVHHCNKVEGEFIVDDKIENVIS
ncbi:MAG: hypothetical protein Hyperionvirus10_33 [Hyperionvirus sp.]|uniref:DNA-directed DNA polymerase n=1 Tax=Hyperionvirus sp. TaxID=2487770 RepID=A0A3G5A8W1_9VIRU|nr:MAG: hypothetical protein Hyperionvirus10_33 [Hyperionvirus sp.]